MLLRARMLVYFGGQSARKKAAFAAFGYALPVPLMVSVEAQVPHVAAIASIGPHKQHAEENALDKSSPIRAPHARAIALRALIHFSGEQEPHRQSP
jgi:hypothetical protein